MRTRTKVLLAAGMTAALTLGSALSAFAGTWRTGGDQNRWWYDFDNGSYAQNGWQWIDGDNDGVAECYYFDSEGWLLTNTTTPDGYTVDGNGAWLVNGVVQTAGGQTQAAGGQTQASGGFQQIYDMVASNADNAFDCAMEDIEEFLDSPGAVGWRSYDVKQRVQAWADYSSTGAAWKEVFDRYNLVAIANGEVSAGDDVGSDEIEEIMIDIANKLLSPFFWYGY